MNASRVKTSPPPRLPVTLLLHVRILPSPIPSEVRVKRALKALLRIYGLRCTCIAPAEQPTTRKSA